jgi:uncharacterized protein YndB with AHSA1/START domain
MENNSTSLWAKVTATIPKTKEKVWEVLTNPKLTELYMYKCQLHSTWKLGSEAVWKEKQDDGTWQDHVVAEVLAYKPYEHLAFKIFHKATEEQSRAVSELHFNLDTVANSTLLTIKQGDFNAMASAKKNHQACQQGWEYVLPKLIASCNT